MSLTARQCRAARAWLGWTQRDLAERAGVDMATVRTFEGGSRKTLRQTVLALKMAFFAAGVILDKDQNMTLPPEK